MANGGLTTFCQRFDFSCESCDQYLSSELTFRGFIHHLRKQFTRLFFFSFNYVSPVQLFFLVPDKRFGSKFGVLSGGFRE